MQIIRALWTEPEVSFQGKYYRLEGAVNQPKGSKNPIPMLIAGAGEKVTLKLVAQYGDGCNVIESPEGVVHKYAVRRRHCDDAVRDYDTILKTPAEIAITFGRAVEQPDVLRRFAVEFIE